jgi:hypothetical protein
MVECADGDIGGYPINQVHEADTHRSCTSVIHFHSSKTLEPFVGPWPLLQFRNHFYTDGRTPWTGDQPVEMLLPTHRTT